MLDPIRNAEHTTRAARRVIPDAERDLRGRRRRRWLERRRRRGKQMPRKTAEGVTKRKLVDGDDQRNNENCASGIGGNVHVGEEKSEVKGATCRPRSEGVVISAQRDDHVKGITSSKRAEMMSSRCERLTSVRPLYMLENRSSESSIFLWLEDAYGAVRSRCE
jgi:hypothetical protein